MDWGNYPIYSFLWDDGEEYPKSYPPHVNSFGKINSYYESIKTKLVGFDNHNFVVETTPDRDIT